MIYAYAHPCGRALSIWKSILLSLDDGHLALMAGNTFSMIILLLTSRFTFRIGFVTMVPHVRFADLLCAGAVSEKSQMPIFPSKYAASEESGPGRATAAPNILFSMNRFDR